VPHRPSMPAQVLVPRRHEMPIPGRSLAPASVHERMPRAAEERRESWGALHLRLLETLSPPSVLVDHEHEIVHLSPSAGQFMQFSGGEPSRNLLRTIHPALRVELRGVLYQAAQSSQQAEVRVPGVPLPDGPAIVQLRVWPVRDGGAEMYMVLLERQVPTRPEDRSVVELRPKDPVATHLDRELERLKAELRETVEQYEASTEELKASNEELQAMNEELR
jgi:two-component system, chemotaxis family, CheB/CheR fusion protein